MKKFDLSNFALRKRAMQCRQLAENTRDNSVRERLLAIAADYDSLAVAAVSADGQRPMDIAERIAFHARLS
jgi:hypothetical protein